MPLLGDRERLIEGKRATLDSFREALAADQFEDEELRAVRFVESLPARRR